MLRAQQDSWLEASRKGAADPPVVRQARRAEVISALLAPLYGRIPETSYERLTESLAMVIGIESLVVLKDTWGASSGEALERMLWAGRVMIEATQAEARRTKTRSGVES
jgi:hypothetical protein